MALHAVFYDLRYAVTYQYLEEVLTKRGVKVDHATLNRCVIEYSPALRVNSELERSYHNQDKLCYKTTTIADTM